jgi:hypothetical protein
VTSLIRGNALPGVSPLSIFSHGMQVDLSYLTVIPYFLENQGRYWHEVKAVMGFFDTDVHAVLRARYPSAPIRIVATWMGERNLQQNQG